MAASTDPIDTSRSLAGQLKLRFPILEDTNHELGSALGVYRLPSSMDMGPVDSHSFLILDRSGRVIWKKPAPDTMHVAMADVLAALRK